MYVLLGHTVIPVSQSAISFWSVLARPSGSVLCHSLEFRHHLAAGCLRYNSLDKRTLDSLFSPNPLHPHRPIQTTSYSILTYTHHADLRKGEHCQSTRCPLRPIIAVPRRRRRHDAPVGRRGHALKL